MKKNEYIRNLLRESLLMNGIENFLNNEINKFYEEKKIF